MSAPRPTWWSRNRYGLLALPLAAALFLGAGSSRLLAERETSRDVIASATQGEWVRFSSAYEDLVGPTRRTVDVRLTALEAVESIEPQAPGGAQAWRVGLDWRAAPDQVLAGCELTLFDADGAAYRPLDPAVQPCVPADAPGPAGPIDGQDTGGREPGEVPRPERWSTKTDVLLPDGVTPARVELRWEPPAVLALTPR